MKVNLRGDSGLSDSGFYKSQRSFLKKHQEALDKMEKCGKIEMQRRRCDHKVTHRKQKRSIWRKFKDWFKND